jgi:hypothetical protein
VSQLSFFSAESVPPAVADLTGVLAAAGQLVTVGDGARLSVVVDAVWRAAALADMMVAAGVQAEITRTEEDTPLVRGVAARRPGTAGLDAGIREPGRRPVPSRAGSARP